MKYRGGFNISKKAPQQKIPLQQFQRETYAPAIFASSYEAQLPQQICITFASLRWCNNGEVGDRGRGGGVFTLEHRRYWRHSTKQPGWHCPQHGLIVWRTEKLAVTLSCNPFLALSTILVARSLCYSRCCVRDVCKQHWLVDEQNRTVNL